MIRDSLLLGCFVSVSLISPACAYIDPNAGGLIFQIVMPILAVGGAMFAVLRRRISRLIGRMRFSRRSRAKAECDVAGE